MARTVMMAAQPKREDPLCVIVHEYLTQSRVPSGQWVPLTQVIVHSIVQQYLCSAGFVERTDQTACLREALKRSGPVLQLDNSGAAVTWLSRQERVKRQVEYYFSDKNLQKDEYLQGLMKSSPGGWVALEELLRWPRMQALVDGSWDTIAVSRALRSSTTVELSSDKHSVRRVLMSNETRGMVRRQMEYYFSDKNLRKDKYLQGLIQGSPGGWVDLKELTSWPNMKKIIGNGQLEGVCSALEESMVVELSPDRAAVRKVIRQGTTASTSCVHGPYGLPLPFSRPTNGDEFSVMTWNLLADSMCTGTMAHTNVPIEYRRWNYRLRLMLRHIVDSRCDLLCLQELNPHHYKELMDGLKGSNYSGCYSPKRGPNGSHVSGSHVLGNATLWNRNLFQALGKSKVVAYAKELRSECRRSGIGDDTSIRHYCGKQVGIICPLQHIRTGRVVLSASTHISCNYENQDTQLAQVVVFLREVQEMQSVLQSAGKECAVVFAGDFNAQPSSAVYKYISEGHIGTNDPHLRPQNPEVRRIDLLNRGISHSLSLQSIFKGNEPKITTIRGHNGDDPGFSGCLDYIWYQSKILSLGEVSKFPDHQKLVEENTGGLPNSWCPSDHLPICARFTFNRV